MSTLLATLLLVTPLIQEQDDPHRQFDFWIGEWSVQNRHMGGDGSWTDGDRTRARITPVCGGMAVLEEWAGPFRGGFMNGFSLRAFDPAKEQWTLLLNWTMDGNGTFGILTGNFRHGRGEFFFDGTARDGTKTLNRYSFSDGLPSTVRWDSAVSKDGGQAWRTDWIMEFSRTRAVEEVTEDRLFDVEWTEGEISPHAEARELDWMIGSWKGVQKGGPKPQEARLRCKTINKACLVIGALQTKGAGDAEWKERFSVRGYVSRSFDWESWSVTSEDSTLRKASGEMSVGQAVFDTTMAETGTVLRETWTKSSDDEIRLEDSRRLKDGTEFQVLSVTDLQRVRE